MDFSFIKNTFHSFFRLLQSRYKWLLIFFCIWFYRIAYIPADSGGIAKALQVGCIAAMFVLLTLYQKYKRANIFEARNKPIVTLLCVYVFATLTSVFSELPQYAFFLSVQDVVILFLLYWIFSIPKTFIGLERLFLMMYLIMMFSQMFFIRQVSYGWTLFVHDLSSGSCSALVISYCVGELLAERRHDKSRIRILGTVAVLAIFNIIVCTSSGANLSAVFGVSIGLLFSGKILYALFLGLVALFFSMNSSAFETILYFIMPGKNVQTVETVTGRDIIWQAIYKVAQESPFLGAGLGCSERIAFDRGYMPVPQPDPHSNFIGCYCNLGIWGCVMFIIHLLSSLSFVLKRKRRTGYVGLLSVLGCATLNGYTYGFLVSKTCGITIVYFAFIMLMYYYSKVTRYV